MENIIKLSLAESFRVADISDKWLNAYVEKIIFDNGIKEISLKKGNGSCDKIIFELPEISYNKIKKTYVGKAHRCMCGCSGKYSDDSGKNSSRSINYVWNKLKTAKTKGYAIQVIDSNFNDGEIIYCLDTYEKTYVMYVRK